MLRWRQASGPRISGKDVQAREVGEEAQLAFGHHRVEAARRVLGKNAEVPLLIGKFTDAQMIQRMGLENAVEYGTRADAELEVIEAIFDAFRHGKLSDEDIVGLRPKEKSSRTRSISGTPEMGTLEFTRETVAAFLGWKMDRADRALSMYDAQHEEKLELEPVRALSATTAREIVTEARSRAKDFAKAGIGPGLAKHEVNAYVREAARAIEKGTVAVRNLRTIRPTGIAKKAPPHIVDFLSDFTAELERMVTETRKRKVAAIEENADLLEPGTLRALLKALRDAGDYLTSAATRIEKVSVQAAHNRQRLLEKEVRS